MLTLTHCRAGRPLQEVQTWRIIKLNTKPVEWMTPQLLLLSYYQELGAISNLIELGCNVFMDIWRSSSTNAKPKFLSSLCANVGHHLFIFDFSLLSHFYCSFTVSTGVLHRSWVCVHWNQQETVSTGCDQRSSFPTIISIPDMFPGLLVWRRVAWSQH